MLLSAFSTVYDLTEPATAAQYSKALASAFARLPAEFSCKLKHLKMQRLVAPGMEQGATGR